MAEVGIDISGHISRQVKADELAAADIIVTLCDKTRGGCPVIPAGIRHVAWTITDPGGLDPNKADDREALRRIREEIRSSVERLILSC